MKKQFLKSQKQPPQVFYTKKKFRKIHKKTPVP